MGEREAHIECSKSRWRHLAEADSDEDQATEVSDVEDLCKAVQMHSTLENAIGNVETTNIMDTALTTTVIESEHESEHETASSSSYFSASSESMLMVTESENPSLRELIERSSCRFFYVFRDGKFWALEKSSREGGQLAELHHVHFNQADPDSNEIHEKEEIERALGQESSPLELSNSESEFLTPPESESSEHSTTSSFFSACSDSMESGKSTSITEHIERSKLHWSELVEYSDSDDDEVAEVNNFEVFRALQMHPKWGNSFFRTFGYHLGVWHSSGELEVGEKFAEGAQAEIYNVRVMWADPLHVVYDLRKGIEYVLKVFKKGTKLRHLKLQWPEGLLQFHAEELERSRLEKPSSHVRYYCHVAFGTLLEDGRFGFLLVKEQEDLRSIIDRRVMALDIIESRLGRNMRLTQGPFLNEDAEMLMYAIACGMDWLHSCNIVHRDLKASNVLYSRKGEKNWGCYIADFECSIGVVGTGFFRAPEILQACKDKNVSRRPELFTKAADVYSYGMTCYEILTGKLPFEGHSATEYDLVLNGQRPELPEYVNAWVGELIRQCWQSSPETRPSFQVITSIFRANSAEIREYDLVIQQQIANKKSSRE